jgi:hypothetical protein
VNLLWVNRLSVNRTRPIFSTILPLKRSKDRSVSPEEMSRHENPYTKVLIDNRPSDYEYALLSDYVYGESTLKKGNVY